MVELECPRRIGEVFALPLEAVEVDPRANVRASADRESLRELAESMGTGGIGQLHPILVVWTEGRWAVAAGFRRVLAMRAFQADMGFELVLARRIATDKADLARLVENFSREDPTTFETCRYLFELARGEGGRPKLAVEEIAAAIGRTKRYVQNLIRFYRVLPEHARKAWADDRDQRFTFRVLSELALVAQHDADEALGVRLEHILAPKPARGAPSGDSPRRPRGVGRRRLAGLVERLAGAGEARLAADDRASTVLELLRAIAGEVPAARADQIINELLADLGVEVAVAHERRR
ncbi:MAG: ParB N-terminal domain-containing protein [Deltaproteobacteria bacterium]|nr:ParB N-terminal domain-containing protein [Deltaproteobacteria bacterium]